MDGTYKTIRILNKIVLLKLVILINFHKNESIKLAKVLLTIFHNLVTTCDLGHFLICSQSSQIYNLGLKYNQQRFVATLERFFVQLNKKRDKNSNALLIGVKSIC